jgi:O-antigen/teichoic acid export membrane protein
MSDLVEPTETTVPGRSGLVGRVSWGILDQAVSSLGNFVLSICAARGLPVSGFGAFSLAFVFFIFLVNASRGVATDPLMVRFSGPETPEWRRAVGAASGAALNLGLLAALCSLAAGLVAGGPVGTSFAALAVGLPGLLLQDSYRCALFSRGQGKRVFLNDLLWSVLQVAGLGVLLSLDKVSITALMLVFGGTATVAAGFGWWQTGLAPRPTWTRSWFATHRSLSGRYLIENIAVGGARQVQVFALGAVAGLAAVAQQRAAEILMGPFLILLAGVGQVSVPEARTVIGQDPGRLRRFCLTLGGIQAALAAGWAVAAMIVLPWGPGELLLGDLWRPAQRLLVPLTLIYVLGFFHAALTAGLRALGASRRSLKAQLVTSTLFASFGVVGAYLGAAWGASWAVVIGLVIGLATWWVQLGHGVRDYQAQARVTPVDRDRSESTTERSIDVT